MASATIEQEQASRFCQVPILGLPVHMIQIPDVVAVMTHWVTHERFRPHWVVVADMHAVVEAHNRADFRRMVRQADLTVPDGISLVKVAQWKGGAVRSRVAGTDLMKAFFFGTQGLGFRHYFYGDTDLTLERLTGNLTRQYPGLTVAGAYSPPFRPMTEEEDEAAIRRINEAKPDVLWVGLGLPKQEQWIYTHRDRLDVPLVLGVGAAFKFLAGTVQRAPDWVGDMGFEWLWRFACEPRRLWKRVMIEGTQFVGLVLLELAGWRDFS
jgi:N-acetylglucosaminyldiphosphoundecaprenol N-acetyl-beta-D-mannosaminyltransferase